MLRSAAMAAPARIDPGDPRVAECCELFIAGLELASGFGRFPIDEEFIAAVGAMPRQAGTERIEDVLWAPIE